MRPADGGDSWPDKSDFEKLSHERLLAMIEQADAGVPNGIGDHLTAAAQHIGQIADQLNGHIGQLDWESRAGESFKAWARQIVSATDQLSAYATVAASNMSGAGSTLGEVKAGMPPVPTADLALVKQYHAQQAATRAVSGGVSQAAADRANSVQQHGGISTAQASAAQSRIDTAHQEAIAQMEKLGSSYEGSTHAMNLAAPPVFPPTPSALMPPRPGSMNSTSGLLTGSSTASQTPTLPAGGGSAAAVSAGGAVPGGTSRTVGATSTYAAPTSPSGTGASSTTHLDGAGGTPASPLVGGVGTGTASLGAGGVRGTTPPAAPGGLFGAVGSGYGGGGSSGEEGIFGGMVSNGSRRSRSGRAGLGGSGNEAGAGELSGSAGRRETGIPGAVGSGNYDPSSAGGEVGLGTGEPEEGAGMTPGEPRVGGSEAPTSQPQAVGGRATMGGGIGGGLRGRTRNKRKARADYLVEDEETWVDGRPAVNPPVIE